MAEEKIFISQKVKRSNADYRNKLVQGGKRNFLVYPCPVQTRAGGDYMLSVTLSPAEAEVVSILKLQILER